MTKFADKLFDDLMREHGPALAHTSPPASTRSHVRTRRAMLAAAGGVTAAAAIAGTLVAGGGSPAYAVTKNTDGTVDLAVYQETGIAGANEKLRDMGINQVIVVPVKAGCPSIDSLPGPGSLAGADLNGRTIARATYQAGGGIRVNVHDLPVGDIFVLGASETNGHATFTTATLTSGPAPSCVSVPPLPPNPIPSHVAPSSSAHVSSAAA